MGRSISFDLPGAGGTIGDSNEDLERMAMRRKLAEALMMRATDASPVGHWTQAVARALQGFQSGSMRRGADAAESKMRGEANDLLLNMVKPDLTGGAPQAAAPPQPVVSQAQQSLAPEQPMTAEEQGVAKFAQPKLAESIASALAGQPAPQPPMPQPMPPQAQEQPPSPPMAQRGLTSFVGMTPPQEAPQMGPMPPPQAAQPPQMPAAQKVAGAFHPSTLVMHDYGGSPKNVPGMFNPYNALVFPDGAVRYRDEKNPYGSKAPHAYKLNGESVGLSYAGPVGSKPTPQALEALRGEYKKINDLYPGITAMSHGEAYNATKGTRRQASKLGRGLDEASWRDDLRNPPPQQMAQQAPQAPPSPDGPAPFQVADSSNGPDRETLKRMLANPYTRDAAQKLILQQQMQQMKPEGATEYGLNIQYARDGQGNIVPYVMGKDGKPKMVDLPNGAKAMAPADISEQRAYGKEKGENLATDQRDLSRQTDNANLALDTIAKIRAHPGRQAGLGMSAWMGMIPGTEARGFSNLVEQSKGQVFLEAFNSLRGGGQITEAEGKKATQALSRLDQWQSESDFENALKDLEDVVTAGLRRANEKAGGKFKPPADGWQDMGNGIRIREKR